MYLYLGTTNRKSHVCSVEIFLDRYIYKQPAFSMTALFNCDLPGNYPVPRWASPTLIRSHWIFPGAPLSSSPELSKLCLIIVVYTIVCTGPICFAVRSITTILAIQSRPRQSKTGICVIGHVYRNNDLYNYMQQSAFRITHRVSLV